MFLAGKGQPRGRGLNPYSNGMTIESVFCGANQQQFVLILILME